jgi:hypothetical protein
MSDQSFIASDRDTVHAGTRTDGPECGTSQNGEWASVDAKSEEEAVMKYNLVPCTRCIDDHYTLELWRKDAYDAVVINSVDAPERWQR